MTQNAKSNSRLCQNHILYIFSIQHFYFNKKVALYLASKW